MQSCQNCDRPILSFGQALVKCLNDGEGTFTVVNGKDYQEAFEINWGINVHVKNLLEKYDFSVLNKSLHTGIDVRHSGYTRRYLVSVQHRQSFKALYIEVLTNDSQNNKAAKIIISFHRPDLDR